MLKKVAFWLTTGLFSLGMAFSAFAELSQSPQMLEGFKHLGYPVYLLMILGVAKSLGVVALLVPRFPRLKEWAYAGFTFDLLGASASHAFSGDPAANVITPLVFLAVLAASYWLYHSEFVAQEQTEKPVRLRREPAALQA